MVGIQLNHFITVLLLYHMALVRNGYDKILLAADIGFWDLPEVFRAELHSSG